MESNKSFEMYSIKERDKHWLDVLWYEIGMLRGTFSHPPCRSGSLDKNLYLECFLLHARNLSAFLYDDPNGDFRCSDFGVQKLQVFTGDTYDKLCKHLSHISAERRSKKVIWYPDKIFQALSEGIINFLDQVDNSSFPTLEGHTRDDFKTLLSTQDRMRIRLDEDSI
ncbi:hypothetical protein COW95_01635 [Candidatus Peregrinibacteria bacterium CG22_combo_CG10-13_8_21_14_all_49_11]|nr:MAG: hypothetical protein COW95_01635 [Candidatus Peregrinibacteria bacterium CG22_combo_CG10-13_8_21_14_all_49_11]